MRIQAATFREAKRGLRPDAAAITLAHELQADWLLLDERKGSQAAQSRGLRVAGTLSTIDEAGTMRLLDYHQTGDQLVTGTTFYVTDDVLRESDERFQQRKISSNP